MNILYRNGFKKNQPCQYGQSGHMVKDSGDVEKLFDT